jgi:Zn-dependent protease
LHEFAHAWSSSLLGDDYARRQGRVSLNPLRHLSPLGTLAIFLLPIGWARPVPVNAYNFRRPRRDYLLSSLAGPAANLLLAGACLLLMHVTRHANLLGPRGWTAMFYIHTGLAMAVVINSILAVINLLPIPPLDGSKIWQYLVPGLRLSFGKLTWVFVLLLILLLQSGSLSWLFDSVINAVLKSVPPMDYGI